MEKFDEIKIRWSDDDEMYVATSPQVEGISALGVTPFLALAEFEVASGLAFEYEAERQLLGDSEQLKEADHERDERD